MSDPEILPSTEPAVPPASPLSGRIFRGPNGIRAGWRVLIFLAIALLLVLAVSAGLRIFTHGRARVGVQVSGITPLGLCLIEGPLLLLTVIPALVMARIERRKFGQYGLPARSAFGKDFWIGTVVGFLAIGTALLFIFALHGFRLTGIAIQGSTIVASAAEWGAAFVLVGLAEEFSFRGYLQFTLTTGIGYWPSAILLSLLFGAAHSGNPGESRFGLFSVVLFGLLFCLFLRRRGNLWWAVGFHAGWDWGQTFFYGVPDSGIPAFHSLFNCSFSGPQWLTGGSVGPEASIFTPIVLAIVAILFSRAYCENRYQIQASDLRLRAKGPAADA
ncbi:MAG TPA: CPBP family intramembrane glutamic endopeptidase [Terriglobales bacterium]|nr:CPBP family intramembrane glutamic endopeptidase [Terriglobales bacterium]